MEDLDEAIRFSTGRRKRQLMRQQERLTIDYTEQQGLAEKEKDFWEQQKQWRDEDHETAKEHREEKQKWAEEDMKRALRHHQETVGMQQARIAAERENYQERYALHQEMVRYQREFWKEQQKELATEIEDREKINKLQREYAKDVLKLQSDYQDKLAAFEQKVKDITFSVGQFENAVNDAGRAIDNLPSTYAGDDDYNPPGPNPPSDDDDDTGTDTGGGGGGGDGGDIDVPGGPTLTKHSGGPVGLFPGTGGDVPAILEEGEYVVPRSGTLIKVEDNRVIELLTRIATAIEEGNGRFQIIVSNPERTIERVFGIREAAYGQ
jgi:hypothetical protein